jgi:hypothetical protein
VPRTLRMTDRDRNWSGVQLPGDIGNVPSHHVQEEIAESPGNGGNGGLNVAHILYILGEFVVQTGTFNCHTPFCHKKKSHTM